MRGLSWLRRRGTLLATAVATALVVVLPIGASSALDQSQELSFSGWSFSHFVAQTVTPGMSGNLDQVDVYIAPTKGAAWPKQMTVSIRATTEGIPSGPALASETLTNVLDWDSVVLDPAAPVTEGTQYAIVVECLGADPVANDICAWRYINTNPYAGGAAMESVNGVNWTTSYYTNNDLTFRTYVSPADATPPTVTCSVNPATLWPPKHKLQTVTASVAVADEGSGPSGFELVSVASSQADSGYGRDDVPGDIQSWTTGTNDTSGALRAERYAVTRAYTLTFEGFDMAGNSALCEATVTVPYSQAKG